MIIGGGLVGVELFGELTAFVDEITPLYKRIRRDEVRFILLQGGERIMPEMNPTLADYGARVLSRRRGVEIRTKTKVRAIEPGKVHLPEETIEAETIMLAAGIVPNPIVASLPVEKDKRGHIMVDGTMRCQSHPEVWAIGDCASIPAPDGKPYPNLAQHALREAKVLAGNLVAVLDGQSATAIRLRQPGNDGLARVTARHSASSSNCEFVASWRGCVRRTYYLLQMPGCGRRLHIVANWIFALLFRPDIVKLSLDSEAAMLLRSIAPDEAQLSNEQPAASPAAPS